MVSADIAQIVLSTLLKAEDQGEPCMGSIELGKQTHVPLHELLPLIAQLKQDGLVCRFHPEVPASVILCLTQNGRMQALSFEPDASGG